MNAADIDAWEALADMFECRSEAAATTEARRVWHTAAQDVRDEIARPIPPGGSDARR
jgi:hypothetical protein